MEPPARAALLVYAAGRRQHQIYLVPHDGGLAAPPSAVETVGGSENNDTAEKVERERRQR